MPEFTLHLKNGNGWLQDPEPQLFDDLYQARDQAIFSIRDILSADVREGNTINLGHFIEIRDASGLAVGRLYFREAVTLVDEPD